MNYLILALLACVAVLACSSELMAAITLPPVFSDHMVLQRGVKVPIWGTATPGAHVTVTVAAQSKTTVADAAGNWKMELAPLAAGGPFTLTVESGTERVLLQDVLVGEVWLCSGQSNMQFGLSSASTAAQAIATANIPALRLSHGKQWVASNPESAKNFSAVAFFFGRALQAHLNMPVGLIATPLGGSPSEAWTSSEMLSRDPYLKEHVYDPWNAYVHALQAEPPAVQAAADPGVNSVNAPSHLFDERIRPLLPFALKGVLWYQGESNAWGFSIADRYQHELPAMIQDWRTHWHNPELNFLLIQLPCYDGTLTPRPLEPPPWALIQEIQAHTAKTLPHVGLVVITELGEKDIHPLQKEPVGDRAALVARRIAYGETTVVDSGPELLSWAPEGHGIRLRFTHTAGGLMTNDGKPLQGFSLAGEDRWPAWAQVRIDGDTIVLQSDEVAHPVSVRYAYAENSLHNLCNKAGLPASPFRTDDWPWDIPAREQRMTRCPRAVTAPIIDGKLDDAIWAHCPLTTGFTLPNTYRASAYPTEARFCYDNNNLYVAFRCTDPAVTKLTARATRRGDEAIWHDDAVELLLDLASDKRTYCRFVFNSTGCVLTGKGFNHSIDGNSVHDARLLSQATLTKGRGFDPTWQGECTVKTGSEATAWVVEAAIPWSTLGIAAPHAGMSFGLQLLHYHAGPMEASEWITTGRDLNTGAMMPGNRLVQSPARFGRLVVEDKN